MKHILTLLFCATAITASAQSYDFLTFQKSTGTETSLRSDHVKITFEGGNLVATNGSETFSAPLNEMAKMFFSNTATGIQLVNTSDDALTASIVNGHLSTNAPVGSRICVIGMDGRQLNPNAPISKGTYLVRINNTTLKVVAQ